MISWEGGGGVMTLIRINSIPEFWHPDNFLNISDLRKLEGRGLRGPEQVGQTQALLLQV